MYCCICGSQNPDGASYCHKCGRSLFREETTQEGQQPAQISPRQVEAPLTEEQQQLIDQLLPIDQKAYECHACGRTDNQYSWDFGLGKNISTQRAWGETAWSVAVSAVTLPLIGVGGLRLPGKKTSLRVLRLRLILCDSCHQRQLHYSLHPWWTVARRLGYTEFLDAKDLQKLEPVK